MADDPLLSQHREQLTASALSEAVIVARGYYSAHGPHGLSTLRGLGFSKAQYHALPGLVLPLWSTSGKPATWVNRQGDRIPLHVYRPDTPIADGRKYELPAGCTMQLDCPPTCQGSLGNPQVPLWLTEGQKKADAIAAQEGCAIALLGVWNWRGKNDALGKTVLADWEHVALEGREVRIAYDSDVLTKPQVQQALERLAQWLTRQGAIVHVVRLPQPQDGGKVGIDDYLAQGRTLDDVLPLLAAWEHSRKADAPAMSYPPGEEWRKLLLCLKNGRPLEIVGNYYVILSHHAAWAGRLELNAMSGLPYLDRLQVTDSHIVEMSTWMSTVMHVPGRSLTMLGKALTAVSMHHPFDPLQDWLGSLPEWDGVPRLDQWLTDWGGANESALTQWIGRMLLVQMVARGLVPGCQARYVVILEGPENTGKSMALEILGAPWKIDFSISMDSKEAHMLIRGKWLAELSELETMSRTSEARLKGFVTQIHDDYVEKYANFPIAVPRRTCFVGTTNDAEYLPGLTGNTRFLPVHTGHWDLDALRSQKEQLFAEALTWYHDHVKDWWVLPEELARPMTAAREERRTVNNYEDPLHTWLDGGGAPSGASSPYRSEVNWVEIAREFLDIASPEHWKDRSLQMQITTALKARKWFRRFNAAGRAVWKRPGPPPDPEAAAVPF